MIDKIIFSINVFIYILNFVFTIMVVYIVIVDSSPFKILNQIFINWELSPISDYYLNNNNYNISCKDEYENAFTYEFPGLINGCDCSNSNSKTLKNKKIIQRDCTYKELKFDCKNINPISAYNFTYFNNLTLCIKREKYFKYQYIRKEKECSENFKSCGIIDTLGNHYCIFNENECEYNFTLFDNKNQNLKNIFSSFIEFRFSQGNICMDNLKFISFSEQPLINSKESTQCENFYSNISLDKRYNKIFTFNTKNLLEKEINNLNISTNYFFDNFLNSNISLYGRKYIGWDDKCYYLLETISPLRELAIIQNNEFLLFYITALFSLVFFLSCGIIMRECTRDKTESGLSVIFVHSIILIYIMYYCGKYYDIYSKIIPTINKIIEIPCSDLYTTLAFYAMKKSLTKIITLFFQIIMVIIVMLVLEFCSYVVFLYDIIKDHITFFYFNGQSFFDFEFNFLN